MRLFIYNLSIRLFKLGVYLASPFSDKANSFVLGRKKLLAKVKREIHHNAPIVWFHCASLGEFEQGRPIMEKMKEEFPHYKILLTFFSPSGYEVRKNYQHADYVYYLPIDTKSNAEKWIDIIKPKAVFFVKYEFWYHYCNTLHRNGIPLFSVSSIFRKNQIYFSKYGKFNRNILKLFTYFFVQDKQSSELLKSIDVNNVTITGDTRFDRVKTIRNSTIQIPVAKAFRHNTKTFVIGSSWQEDMEVLAPFINQMEEKVKFIIAPHEIYEMGIRNIEKQIDRKTIRYSDATIDNVSDYDVLIIDNVGMLSSIYQYGDYAYVGGAFGKGLHNILEAATFGLPVFFGNKNYKKFKEAVDLVQLNGGYAVADYHDFKQKFTRINLDIASTSAQSYVEGNIGASEKIFNFCKKHLS